HLAKDYASAFTMEKLRAMVDREERQIQSLIRLIEDMLDVSRIRTGKLSMRPSPFDLSELVSQWLESFAAEIDAADS
ncbi:hybrid sensor histidine kinase/response regulator, partial [Pseudomonas syringae pv. tagetis]